MSIFPTKILLATDSSEEADLVLSTAIDLAHDTNYHLHVVTVGPWNPRPCLRGARSQLPLGIL
jgi:nucleotide-binding universal stress UspA family protein